MADNAAMLKVLQTPNATGKAANLQTPQTRREAVELWTDKEVCEFLACEPRTLRLWRNTRGFPFIRITSKVLRYRRPDVEKWLDSRRVQIRGN